MVGLRGDHLFRTSGKNQTVDAVLYVQQMERVKMAIQEKRPNRLHGVLLLHDNARPHITKRTKEAIEEYGWEVLPHPPNPPIWHQQIFTFLGHCPMLFVGFHSTTMQN